jgi:hypothetical protein
VQRRSGWRWPLALARTLAMTGWVARPWVSPWVAWPGAPCGRRRGPMACVPARAHGGRRHKRTYVYMRRTSSFERRSVSGILLGLLAKIKCSICSYQFNI